MNHIYTIGNVPNHWIVLISENACPDAAKFAAVQAFASTEE
uniref:Uncharacterized protein n=1 Tax=Brugia malayi TaxID=6279 RepID=A8PTU3_BRUMA